VKSFNLEKGFGFISSRAFPGDVYFKFPGGGIASGTPVSFVLRLTADGKAQGLNVEAYEDHLAQAGPGEGEQLLGSIKSINPEKGFGFIDVAGHDGDAYFKVDDLPAELQALDEHAIKTQQVLFNVHLTPDGKMQARGLISADGVDVSGFAQQTAASAGTKRPASAMTPSAPAFAGKPQLQKQAKYGGGLSCTVKTYNPAKGWGFLTSPEMPTDIYFQRKLLPEGSQPAAGMQGVFEVAFTPDGKPQAVSLQLW